MADDDRPPLESFVQRPPLESFAKPTTSGKIPERSQMGAGEQLLAGINRGVGGYPQLAAHIGGTPEQIARNKTSLTGKYLKDILEQ